MFLGLGMDPVHRALAYGSGSRGRQTICTYARKDTHAKTHVLEYIFWDLVTLAMGPRGPGPRTLGSGPGPWAQDHGPRIVDLGLGPWA